MVWGSRRSPLRALLPCSRAGGELGALPAGHLRPQAGGAGDAAPQPGKRVPAPAPALPGEFGPGAEERTEDAGLPLKRRVALLGAILKARPGAGWCAKMRGTLQLSQRWVCPGQSCRSQLPRLVFSITPGEVTRLSLLFHVGFGKSDTV